MILMKDNYDNMKSYNRRKCFADVAKVHSVTTVDSALQQYAVAQLKRECLFNFAKILIIKRYIYIYIYDSYHYISVVYSVLVVY